MSVELKVLDQVDQTDQKEEISKEEYIVNYLKSMIAIEQAIEPYKEQKKQLRKEYIGNGWLTRQDIWSAIKALRLYEQDTDMDDLNDMFETVEKQFGDKSVI